MSKFNDNARLREGYVRKGGINPHPSQIKERPAPPAPMRPAITEAEKGASLKSPGYPDWQSIDTASLDGTCVTCYPINVDIEYINELTHWMPLPKGPKEVA